MLKNIAILVLLLGASVSVHAIEFWHSGTYFVNGGQCSAQFTFDSFNEDVADLKVFVAILNNAGKKIGSEVLEIQQFGEANVVRYETANLEGEEICNDDLTIKVLKATAKVNGKPTDLLKTTTLSLPEFKPFKIQISR